MHLLIFIYLPIYVYAHNKRQLRYIFSVYTVHNYTVQYSGSSYNMSSTTRSLSSLIKFVYIYIYIYNIIIIYLYNTSYGMHTHNKVGCCPSHDHVVKIRLKKGAHAPKYVRTYMLLD